MSSSELGFLAIGLGVCSAAGAALLVAARSRHADRPAVHVTITPNAIPPRAARLAAAGAVSLRRSPVPGSPEDDAWRDAVPIMVVPASATPDYRTRVPSGPVTVPAGAIAIPVADGAGASFLAGISLGLAAPLEEGVAPSASSTAVAVAIASPDHPPRPRTATLTMLDVGGEPVGAAVRTRSPIVDPRPAIGLDAIGFRIVASKSPAGPADPGTADAAASPGLGACAEERAAAAAQCAAADTARDAGKLAADALRAAQRAHLALEARVEEAGAIADPRRVAEEKDRLHAAFIDAHGRATGADEAEAAARAWLTDVSELNDRVRDAAHRVQAGTAELRAQAQELDRLGREAEAARIAAERAAAECGSAREQLAACEERQQAERIVPTTVHEDPLGEHWPGGPEPGFDRRPTEPPELDRLPAVIRILRGDTAAREAVVATLAGDDPSSIPAWQVRMARLVDAISARAIEDGYLDLPADDPFWGLFDVLERREIVGALASLGFRYDGLQGFEDGRVPSARDVSLAVGYAGLDRMRIRTWPGPSALAELYSRAIVSADLWLAHQADELTLGRVVDALGSRAADLAEVWDSWGRVRPALLSED